ncbi:uncharacterized protein BCR38DRAFT_476853 [Pseudomassariella vexata]|uniref:Uncharacterized protein n=1 Tax=Pseudomassariella vexata TaxID=1141098 RepID=A0A1Y2DL17_9PEZI|nr:uncharacterized protein BCR38DRAFT_476853 [Pseudomassariella vexata]ORY59937.1 hypothetical protein BCR38DRAFT_476853 [Pseudomassariella vexata]
MPKTPSKQRRGRVTRSMSGRQQLLLPPPPVVTDNNEEDTTVLPDLPSGGLTNERPSQIPVFSSSLKDVERLWVRQNALGNQPLGGKLKKVLTLLTIHIVTGAAKDHYVRWEITDQKFWSALQLQDPAASALASAPTERIKEVFVEITCGGPFDTFLVRLSKDRRRATGLFVQLYGDENEVPCRSCSKRLISSETGDHLAISFGLNALRRLYAQYKEHSSQAVRSNEGAQGAKGSPSGQGKGFWG